LNRSFSGENAKKMRFCRLKKMKAVTVYHFYINYIAMKGKIKNRAGRRAARIPGEKQEP
jgi:hypothetical protein